jgi:bifunctional DNase/RNase
MSVLMKIDSVRRKDQSEEWAVILREIDEEVYLPIYVGNYQAHLIRRELISPRPYYYDLNLEDIDNMGIDTRFAKLDWVVIDSFLYNAFHAQLQLEYRGSICEIDYPVAKAIALAIRTNALIIVEEQVLEQAAIGVGNAVNH